MQRVSAFGQLYLKIKIKLQLIFSAGKKMVHTDSEWQTAENVVKDALQNTSYACQCLERLPGGFINFTFRNRLATPIEGHGETVVVKMTEDKLKVEKTTGEEFILHKTRSVSVSLCTMLIIQIHIPRP